MWRVMFNAWVSEWIEGWLSDRLTECMFVWKNEFVVPIIDSTIHWLLIWLGSFEPYTDLCVAWLVEQLSSKYLHWLKRKEGGSRYEM